MTFPAPIRESLRQREAAKYNQDYYRMHYWAEDLPGRKGNKSLSYNDPEHYERFEFLATTLLEEFEFNSFLDAGCGLGLLMLRLSERGIASTGIDVSSVAKALYEAIPAGRNPRPRFEVGFLHTIPFCDRSFDLTWCSDVLEHVPIFDIELSIAELIRVTKKHLVVTINMDNPYEFHPTILSRDTWRALFGTSDELVENEEQRARLQSRINRRYTEYEVFVFQRTKTLNL